MATIPNQPLVSISPPPLIGKSQDHIIVTDMALVGIRDTGTDLQFAQWCGLHGTNDTTVLGNHSATQLHSSGDKSTTLHVIRFNLQGDGPVKSVDMLCPDVLGDRATVDLPFVADTRKWLYDEWSGRIVCVRKDGLSRRGVVFDLTGPVLG